MNREELEDAVYEMTGQDMDLIESLTDAELREILRPRESVKQKPRVKKAAIVKPVETCSIEYVEHEGALHKIERYTFRPSVRVACGDRVQFEGRTVSASIVLHWLRTGEIVKRVPRVRKIKAAIRHNGRVIHLGRFETREAVQAAKDAAKFRLSLGLSPIG